MQNQSSYEYRVKFDPFSELNNPDNLPYHINPCILPKGIDELHYHDGIELGYCSEGSGIFIIEKEVISFQAPCVSIIYPQQFHKAKSAGNHHCVWEFVSFCPEIPMTHLNLFSPFKIPDASQSIFSNNNILFTLIKELVIELENQDTDFLESTIGLLKTILVKHSRLVSDTSMKSTDTSILTRIGPILNYVSHNYKKDISIHELASLFHISPATLRRWFTDCLHLSPLQYLHKVRTTTASSLLLNTNLSVLQIALDVGYQSQSSFQRQFQQHYHCTPTEYKVRKRI